MTDPDAESDTDDAIAPHMFEQDGDRFLPTEVTSGPWDAGALHAGPVAALFGRTITAAASGDRWLARLTLELLRPVPLAPLTLDTTVTRPGRRVETIGAELLADGTPVARAEGLLIAVRDTGLDESTLVTPPNPAYPPPAELDEWKLRIVDRVSFGHAMELRPASGRPFEVLGPAAVWFRLKIPTLAGTEITPLDRALTTADFPNGTSNVVGVDDWTFVNPDLTVILHRLPAADWVMLDAATWMRRGGYGMAAATLADADGLIGTAQQTLVLDAT